jgi:hypothetical protein
MAISWEMVYGSWISAEVRDVFGKEVSRAVWTRHGFYIRLCDCNRWKSLSVLLPESSAKKLTESKTTNRDGLGTASRPVQRPD